MRLLPPRRPKPEYVLLDCPEGGTRKVRRMPCLLGLYEEHDQHLSEDPEHGEFWCPGKTSKEAQRWTTHL